MGDNDATSLKLPGNVNTLWIIGVGLAAFIGNQYVSSYKLDEIGKQLTVINLKADSVGNSIQTMSVTLGQHDVEIKNLQDRVSELSRQAGLRTFDRFAPNFGPPAEFRSSPK